MLGPVRRLRQFFYFDRVVAVVVVAVASLCRPPPDMCASANRARGGIAVGVPPV